MGRSKIRPVTQLHNSAIEEYLAGLIDSGSFKSGDRLPPERELARKFHTSNSPVRQAIRSLTGRGLVKSMPGRGIFVQDKDAAVVRTGKIGLFHVPLAGDSTFNPNHSDLLSGIEQELALCGYKMILQPIHDDGNGAVHKLFNEMATEVDGFIILGCYHDMYKKIHAVKRLSQKPFVFLYYAGQDNDVDYIVSDNYNDSFRMTNFLLEQGHTRIACITNKGNIDGRQLQRDRRITVQDRIRGYRHALQDAGIAVREEYLLALENRRDSDGFRRLMALDAPPTAVFCTGDFIALALYRFAYDMRLRIPDDLAVTGYSNMSEAAYAVPALTTVDNSGVDVGRSAVRKIMDCLEAGSAGYTGTTTVFPGKIVERESHMLLTKGELHV